MADLPIKEYIVFSMNSQNITIHADTVLLDESPWIAFYVGDHTVAMFYSPSIVGWKEKEMVNG
jgi:hypothetical protein